jgi:hypothetical protein
LHLKGLENKYIRFAILLWIIMKKLLVQ